MDDYIEDRLERAETNFRIAEIDDLTTQYWARKGYQRLQEVQEYIKETQPKTLEELNEKINKLEKDIENGKKEIKKLKDKLEVMNEEKEKLEQRIEKGNKYKDRVKSGDVNELSNLKEDLKAAKDEIDNDSTDQSKLNKLEGKIENINEDIKKLNKQISNIENIEKAEKRIEELQEKEETLSNKYEDLEKELYDTEKYIHTKIDMVESDVNDLFEITKFKLFEEQVNGAIKETCKALKDGVPYSDMNTGSQYQVGIDIINVLSDYYNFNAPVFIDNRERIAKLPKIESQTIHLIMSPQRKEMEIVDLSNKSADEIVEEEGGIKEESLF